MREIFSKIKAGLTKWTTQSTGISDPVNHKRIMAMSNEEVINEFNTTVDTAVITWSQEKLVFHHPFWQNPHFIRALDFEATQKVLNLIEAYAVHYPQMAKFAFASDTELLNNLGLKWSRPSHFQSIQTHILEKLSAQNKQTLMPRIQDILRITWAYGQSNAWLMNAEQFLAHGGQLPWAVLGFALYHNNFTPEHRVQLSQFPHVIHKFNTGADDDLLISFSTADIPIASDNGAPSTWLFKTHPQANAWRLGDHPRLKYQLEHIATSLPDKELFKAWHGLELNPEEALKNPLAQLLYAHKHTLPPTKIEPLPATWSASLALANTGMQFKEMLQMYEHTPPTGLNFALPEMSVQ